MRPLLRCCPGLVCVIGLASLVGCSTSDAGSAGSVTRPDVLGLEIDPASVPCSEDADCAGIVVPACVQARCDGAAGSCALATLSDGTACTNGEACVIGEQCLAGSCQAGVPRPPACGDLACGADLCGNACGDCAPGLTCVAGACVQPRQCGAVTRAGCCTAEGIVQYCNDEGSLETVDCAAVGGAGLTRCGWSEVDQWYDCGGDEAASADPALPYLCGDEACSSVCVDRECGYDCGTSCGDCSAGGVCREGQCEAGTCGELSAGGCCFGRELRWCAGGEARSVLCADACGWIGADGYYGCGGEGEDPTGGQPMMCPGSEVEPGPELGGELAVELGGELAVELGGELAVEPVEPAVEPAVEPVEPAVESGPELTVEPAVESGPELTVEPAVEAGPELDVEAELELEPAVEAGPDAGSDADSSLDGEASSG